MGEVNLDSDSEAVIKVMLELGSNWVQTALKVGRKIFHPS